MTEHEISAQNSTREATPTSGSPVVILNPASDRGRTKTLRGKLERALMGGRGELVLTDGHRAAEKLAARAALEGRGVVAVGGDGTITEAASGILATGRMVPFGIVPAGSGNDYAYVTLGLPHDPFQALEIALTGPTQRMDAGQVNDRYFANSLSVGIDATWPPPPRSSNAFHSCGDKHCTGPPRCKNCCCTTIAVRAFASSAKANRRIIATSRWRRQ